MKDGVFRWRPVSGTVVLAAVLWFVTFYLPWGTFWFKISLAALTLAALSFVLQPRKHLRFAPTPRTLALGLASAAVLYLVFWAGKAVSTTIFAFASEQIGSIYDKGEGTPVAVIALLLFFVTGPCEELYWRGYLQRQLMRRFGRNRGWLLASAVYGGVHIWSFNFMLVGAAAVAGLFWGAMYRRYHDLTPVIISHSIWSTFIFAVMPVP